MVWPMRLPRPAQAQPRCVSRIWPTFIRLGTPSGLSTMSTCVPSSRNGMSSIGTILDTPLQLLDLVEEALLQPLLGFVVLFADRLDLGHQLVVGRGELPPLRARIFLQHRPGDLGVLFEALRPGDALPALEHLGQASVDVAVEDRLLVVAVLGEPLDF